MKPNLKHVVAVVKGLQRCIQLHLLWQRVAVIKDDVTLHCAQRGAELVVSGQTTEDIVGGRRFVLQGRLDEISESGDRRAIYVTSCSDII